MRWTTPFTADRTEGETNAIENGAIRGGSARDGRGHRRARRLRWRRLRRLRRRRWHQRRRQDAERYIGANTQFPNEFAAWQQDIANQFKTQTGATVKWETFASANDEVTKIQTSAVSGNGPDIYGVGTTMTPTAYATGAFVKLDDAAWQKVGGKDKFVPATLGISGPDANNLIGIPWASRPFVMAYNKDLLKAAGIDKPATTWDELGQQAKKMTHGDQYGLAVAYKDNFDPWKFAWGMSIQAGNPLVDGKTAKINDPTVKKAYQTYFGWLTTDQVVEPGGRRMEQHAGPGGVRQGQDRLLRPHDADQPRRRSTRARSRASGPTRCSRRCRPA